MRQTGEVLPRYPLRTLSASRVNAFDSRRITIVVTQRLQPQWARRGPGATVTSSRRPMLPALKAAIEDLKADRLQAGWNKLERHGVVKEVIDGETLRERAVEQHLKR